MTADNSEASERRESLGIVDGVSKEFFSQVERATLFGVLLALIPGIKDYDISAGEKLPITWQLLLACAGLVLLVVPLSLRLLNLAAAVAPSPSGPKWKGALWLFYMFIALAVATSGVVGFGWEVGLLLANLTK